MEIFKSSEDPGVQLVYGLVMAKENYVYEVNEVAKYRLSNNRDNGEFKAGELQVGGVQEADLKKGESNQISNASKTVKGGEGNAYAIPLDPKVDGHVVVAPVTNCVRKKSDNSKPKSRASIIFHELSENFKRTTRKMPYHGGVGIGAHKTANSDERRFSPDDNRRDTGHEGEADIIKSK